jgi:hypothetical protein
MFAQTSGGEIYSTTFAFNKGYIKVTYDAEVETTDDPGHDFTSITTSGRRHSADDCVKDARRPHQHPSQSTQMLALCKGFIGSH